MLDKVLYVTSRCPFDNWEIWAIREINSLIDENVDLTVVPRTGHGKILSQDARNLLSRTITTPYLNLKILIALLQKVLINPNDFFFILKWVILQSDSIFDFVKGFVVLPKSIYIGKINKNKGYTHVHAYSTTTVSVVAFIIAHEMNVPWSVTFHSAWHLNKVHLRSTMVHLQSVSFVRAISNEVSNSLNNFTENKFTSKIKTLHIGVKCEELKPNILQKPNDFTIVSIGWLLPHKGIDVSLNVAKELLNRGITNFKWYFYGEGPLLRELLKQVKLLSLSENVIFAGNIDNMELLDLYRSNKIDLLIQNSIQRFGVTEGIPVSLMEAMSFAIPVIATDCGGIKELVDGETGILVNQNDPSTIADYITKFMADDNFKITIAGNGRNKILNDFNTIKISKSLVELFDLKSSYDKL